MPRVLLRDKSLDIERRAFSRVERGDAFIELGAQTPQLLDMRQQLPADLLLIGFRELFDLCEGAFEDFCHPTIVADRAETG
jgi:hypothetical protein